MLREGARDLVARAAVIVLFTLLSINLLGDFLKTGRTTGLLLLASEALVVVLMVVRRRAQLIDRSLGAGAITVVSLAGPPLLRAANVQGVLPDVVTTVVSADRPLFLCDSRRRGSGTTPFVRSERSRNVIWRVPLLVGRTRRMGMSSSAGRRQ